MDKDKRAGKELLVLSGAHGLTHVFPVSVGALLPLLKGEFQISYLLIGIITLLIRISLSLASIPAAILADASYNKGELIGVTFLLVTLCCVLLFFTHSLISAIIILMSISILLSVSHPAAQSHLSTAYRDKKGSIFGVYEAGGSVGMIIAPVGVGLLAINYGWRALYLVWGGLGILIFWWIYFVFRNNHPQMRKKKIGLHFSKHLIEGTKIVHSHIQLKSVLLLQGVIGFLFGGIVTFLPIFLVDTHSFSVKTAGYTLALFLTVGALGKLIGGYFSDRWSKNKTMAACFLGICPLLGSIPFLQGNLLFIILLIIGFGFFMIIPSNIALVGEITEKNLGFNYGLQYLIGAGFAAASRFLCGWIADTFAIQNIFLLFSGAALFGGGFVIYFLLMKSYFESSHEKKQKYKKVFPNNMKKWMT